MRLSRRLPALHRLVTVLCICPILYVLSIGPVLWLTFHEMGPSPSTIETMYRPLWITKKTSPAAAQAIDAYISQRVTIFGRAEFDDLPSR